MPGTCKTRCRLDRNVCFVSRRVQYWFYVKSTPVMSSSIQHPQTLHAFDYYCTGTLVNWFGWSFANLLGCFWKLIIMLCFEIMSPYWFLSCVWPCKPPPDRALERSRVWPCSSPITKDTHWSTQTLSAHIDDITWIWVQETNAIYNPSENWFTFFRFASTLGSTTSGRI